MRKNPSEPEKIIFLSRSPTDVIDLGHAIRDKGISETEGCPFSVRSLTERKQGLKQLKTPVYYCYCFYSTTNGQTTIILFW
jgi:hypothetical protein